MEDNVHVHAFPQPLRWFGSSGFSRNCSGWPPKGETKTSQRGWLQINSIRFIRMSWPCLVWIHQQQIAFTRLIDKKAYTIAGSSIFNHIKVTNAIPLLVLSWSPAFDRSIWTVLWPKEWPWTFFRVEQEYDSSCSSLFWSQIRVFSNQVKNFSRV